MLLRLRSRSLDLSTPVVMGVLNVTPDSFSDGGRFLDTDDALRQALKMLSEGAAIIDVGGESTRPGAQPVAIQEELDRVIPVIEQLRKASDCVISIDTMKPVLMRAACAAGADLINDVMALRAPGALTAALETGAAVCLMHMQGEPRTMQQTPLYGDVLAEVGEFLAQRAQACEDAGIPRNRLLLDPGFGFGKTLQHNLQLLAGLEALTKLKLPLLIGVSRKSMFGQLLGASVEDRLYPGLAAAALAVWQGAAIVRTHDVKATVDAVRVAAAVRAAVPAPEKMRNQRGVQ
jgi:dihydropteroate synthase